MRSRLMQAQTGTTITVEQAAAEGRLHVPFWSRVRWLLECHRAANCERESAASTFGAPDYVTAKTAAYLDYIASPPAEHAEAYAWRLTNHVQVGPAIRWLMHSKVAPPSPLPAPQ
ncbi:MAG: hypothetical protein EOO77_20435 [Oxalobacteraceae bacterium]|nr:MAG: hypothetical protein EOO77_20435 [Oxalobacteraceae bacterium]